MADIFVSPTKEQIKKARELYGDPLLYWAVNTTIKVLNEMKGKDITPNYWREFYRMSRLMISNYGASTTFNLVELASEDLADGLWLGKEFELPDFKEEKVEIKIDPSAVELKDKIKIADIARKYGLKVKRNMALCPFHEDKNPSLSLSDKKGLFNCFGCGAKGDLITFVRMMEDLRDDK